MRMERITGQNRGKEAQSPTHIQAASIQKPFVQAARIQAENQNEQKRSGFIIFQILFCDPGYDT